MVVGHDYGAALGGQVENVSEVVLTYEILAAHNANVNANSLVVVGYDPLAADLPAGAVVQHLVLLQLLEDVLARGWGVRLARLLPPSRQDHFHIL